MEYKTATQQVAEARASIDNLSPDQVQAETAQGALVVDVREGTECALGMIAGALHIPRGLLEFRADPASPMHHAALDPKRRTILYCASGSRSALSAITLRQLGFTNVAHLGGGFRAWVAAGKPVAK
ncbi:MAG: rhodanese-like domain-containing protein [Rhodanobacteraceae bacterium]|nr:MAG: rhodanese-like domain-containing protein [Rhodanobacteraceae bacterium]